MAIEPKRGCGFRKVGGLYLMGSGGGAVCDRLPIELSVCPCCNQGIKQARGWTWIDLPRLVGGQHAGCGCGIPRCPLCKEPERIGRAGLLWIGERFYKTPGEFMREGSALGISRRVSAVPRGFKLGETWVMLAHPKTIPCPAETCSGDCERCGGSRYLPGIFHVFMPLRIEKIITESQATAETLADLDKAGITPVVVPDNDRDHQGNVYDQDKESSPLFDGPEPGEL